MLGVADQPDEEARSARSGFESPRYPGIPVALDETPAATFALRDVVPYAIE